jgi:hypothetical protein
MSDLEYNQLDTELEDGDYEIEDEPYDCPIHGLQDGSDCPLC